MSMYIDLCVNEGEPHGVNEHIFLVNMFLYLYLLDLMMPVT
jgi:hypothetical protein